MSTPKADISPFLRAGTILQRSGNTATTVAAEVQRMPRPGWLRLLQRYGTELLVLLLLVIFGAGAAGWGYQGYQQVQADRAVLERLFSEATVTR